MGAVAGDMAALGATVGEGEGCGCVAGSLEVIATLVEFPVATSFELSAAAKTLAPQRHRNIRTSVVLLVAFVIRD
jgi:hypothetical protein